MTLFDVSIDLSSFREKAKKTIETMGSSTREVLHEALIEGADHARRNHPHKTRTGRLTSLELYSRILNSSASGALGELVNDTPYARYVEFGTRPHQIWPKEGHGFVGPVRSGQSRRALTDIGTHRVALRWYVGGRPVFAAYVNHPGSRPYPFMWPASLAVENAIYRDTVKVTFVRAASIWN